MLKQVKKKWLLILLPVLIVMWGCGFFRAPGKDQCEKILPREKMTEILTDVYLLEGFLAEESGYNPEVTDSVNYYYAWLFARHNTTYEEFREALDCYLLHRSDMEDIHEEMLNQFSIMEGEARAAGVQPEPERR